MVTRAMSVRSKSGRRGVAATRAAKASTSGGNASGSACSRLMSAMPCASVVASGGRTSSRRVLVIGSFLLAPVGRSAVLDRARFDLDVEALAQQVLQGQHLAGAEQRY